MLLKDLVREKILSEDLISKSYLHLREELSKEENSGSFKSINSKDFEKVISAFKRELSLDAYQSLVEGDNLLYQNIIFGIRQEKRYLFCIDKRNSLDKEIQKSIRRKPIRLDFDNQSFLFYPILNINDLDGFLTAFFRWLNSVLDPVE